MAELKFGALVGLDWGDASHEVTVWDEQRQVRADERIEHTPAAVRAWIETLCTRFGGAPVAVAIMKTR